MPNQQLDSRTELQKKSAKLKGFIYDFIKKRDYEKAKQVLDSYTSANPTDPDIKDIGGMIETAYAEEREEIGRGRVALPDKMTFLERIETIFILSKMNYIQNGIMNSVLRKAKLMEERWGYSPTILVCDHTIDLNFTDMFLRSSWEGSEAKLKARTKMLGVYNYFQGSYAQNLENKAVFEKASDGMRYEETSKGVYEVYDGDVLVRKE